VLITPSLGHPHHDVSSPRPAGRTRSVSDHAPHRLLAGFLFACVAVWAEPLACRGKYLTGQSAWLVNDAERHRAGLRAGTVITAGTADFLVNRRMNKSQQMR
jgi:hypothetical protein